MHEVFVWLGAYGHRCFKPTQLLSTASWSRRLYRPISAERRQVLSAAETVQHLVHDSATLKPRITGANTLKGTQEYPKAYGEAVFSLWESCEAAWTTHVVADPDEHVDWDLWLRNQAAANFEEAALSELASFLNVPTHAPL